MHIADIVWYEIGHSFIDPLTEIYIKGVTLNSKIMDTKYVCYRRAASIMNEHIIRAL